MNWIKRNWLELLWFAWFSLAITGVVDSVLTAHAQKPEPPKFATSTSPNPPSFTWSNSAPITDFGEPSMLYLAKDGTVMFSAKGVFEGEDSVALNLRCDPRKEGENWWRHCKAEPIQKCPSKP